MPVRTFSLARFGKMRTLECLRPDLYEVAWPAWLRADRLEEKRQVVAGSGWDLVRFVTDTHAASFFCRSLLELHVIHPHPQVAGNRPRRQTTDIRSAQRPSRRFTHQAGSVISISFVLRHDTPRTLASIAARKNLYRGQAPTELRKAKAKGTRASKAPLCSHSDLPPA